ncbi:MAG: M20/M25/M40 family metallo-hydrolase [Verrucomicrobia bacterium]|nr:M20/M25/M40 family metallo-hydrolase [Verrucomicrobiota bacterium]
MDPIRMLRELVALPSVNPAFLPAGDPLGGEERATAWLAALADRWGLGVERQSVLPGRDNLWVRLEPSGRRRQRVILAPHLDTVAAMPKQLRPVRRDGRLYGRGACDTKGSVAAMFSALGKWRAAGAGRRTPKCCLRRSWTKSMPKAAQERWPRSVSRRTWPSWGAHPVAGHYRAQRGCLAATRDAGQGRPRRAPGAGS